MIRMICLLGVLALAATGCALPGKNKLTEVRVVKVIDNDHYECGQRGKTYMDDLGSRERFSICGTPGDVGDVFRVRR